MMVQDKATEKVDEGEQEAPEEVVVLEEVEVEGEEGLEDEEGEIQEPALVERPHKILRTTEEIKKHLVTFCLHLDRNQHI